MVRGVIYSIEEEMARKIASLILKTCTFPTVRSDSVKKNCVFPTSSLVDLVVSTSEESCFSVCVRFLLASANARVSNFGL